MIKMDTLIKLYSDLNFSFIQSYIQSGNVVFQNIKTKNEILEKKIEEKIIKELGFNVPVLVKDLNELTAVINNNPFVKKYDISSLYITFLSKEVKQENIDKLIDEKYPPDEFIIIGKTIYLYCPNGYSKTKLTNTFFENKLKTKATTRNWKTVTELFNIAEQISNI